MSRRFIFRSITPAQFMSRINALNWSRDAFCARTGYNETTVKRWMTGEKEIPTIVPIFLHAMTFKPAREAARAERNRLLLEDRENQDVRE